MQDLQQRLREALEAGPPVRLAILFGSRARGVARPDSDVDVAILPADCHLSLAAENEIARHLEGASGAPVDLVRLDRASDALKWRVARDGVLLLSDPPNMAVRFLARAGIEHDERREIQNEARRRYRARLALSTPDLPR